MNWRKKNEQWLITAPYYKEWAFKQQIEAGDRVLNVDGIQIEDIPSIKYDSVIRAANELTILKPDGKRMDIQINHEDIPQQFYSVLIVPASYFFSNFNYLVLFVLQTEK